MFKQRLLVLFAACALAVAFPASAGAEESGVGDAIPEQAIEIAEELPGDEGIGIASDAPAGDVGAVDDGIGAVSGDLAADPAAEPADTPDADPAAGSPSDSGAESAEDPAAAPAEDSAEDPAAAPAEQSAEDPAADSAAESDAPAALAPRDLAPQDELDTRASAAAGLIADDTYCIRSIMGDQQVVDVSGLSVDEGGNAIAWNWNGGENQEWEVAHDAIGYVSLRSVLSGLLLTVDGTKSGANVNQQADLAGSAARAQKWIIEQDAEGRGYTITSALSPNLVLDLTGYTSQNGTNVEVWTPNGTDANRNQVFQLIDATPEVAPSTAIIEEGYYTLQSKASAHILDISGQSVADGANAVVWTSNDGTNQLFRVTVEGGYHRLTAVHSERSLDVAEGCPIPGANIQQAGTAAGAKSSLFSVTQNPNGSYTLTNVASGLVMTVAGSGKGANVYGDAVTGGTTQQFKLIRRIDLLTEGLYEITPATNSQMRLDVSGQSRDNGANVAIWTDNGGQNQKWDIMLVAGKQNTYTIQAVMSGAYLAAEGTGKGANVSQRAIDAGNAAAQWVPSYSGGRVMFQNVASGMMLDVTGCGAKAGTNIEIWTANGTSAQSFSLARTHPIGNGYYYIEFEANADLVLDVSGKATGSGGNVISYTNNAGGNQKWYFQRQSDGTYKILNAHSELPLAVAGASAVPGTNVEQASASSSAAQRWNLVYNHDGSFSIASALDSSVVLSIAGGVPSNSANADIQSNVSNDGQRFIFESTDYAYGTLTMSDSQLAMYKRAQGYSSPTDWLILIDNDACWVGVFKYEGGRWLMERYFRCSNGKGSTPTVRGTYYVGAKGYTFGSDQGHACYWYTQIYGDYLFHSTLYQPYSFYHLDSRLGMHLSNGCVRLHIDNAKYIYDYVPHSTKIVSYN